PTSTACCRPASAAAATGTGRCAAGRESNWPQAPATCMRWPANASTGPCSRLRWSTPAAAAPRPRPGLDSAATPSPANSAPAAARVAVEPTAAPAVPPRHLDALKHSPAMSRFRHFRGAVLPLGAAMLLAACASAPRAPREVPTPPPPPGEIAGPGTLDSAVANLAASSGTLVSGRMVLVQAADGVRVRGQVGGLVRNGAHGLQVHERGDCSAVDARSAGRYYDPLAGARQDGA